MLQRVAVCCSGLQCDAIISLRCSMLQWVTVGCSGLQRLAIVSLRCSRLQQVVVGCSVLQCVAVCCSVLLSLQEWSNFSSVRVTGNVTAQWNTLQHTATH